MVLVPIGVSVALWLSALVALAMGLRRGRRRKPLRAHPRVSILKPLAGGDDELRENLDSFARIDYPDYEILFGIASIDDPALSFARGFVKRHPFVDARIVVTDPDAALNPKVAQLLGLEPKATGDVIVISDSNVRVGPDYLNVLVAEISEPGVGLVSSIVAGSGEDSVGAAVENLNLGASVTPLQVLIETVTGKALQVGKSMAMWRAQLRAIGALPRLKDVLAEDFLLGRFYEEAGYEARLSLVPIENRNVQAPLWRSLERHVRWSRMRAWVSPVTFLFEPLGCPVLVATIAMIADPTRLTAAALATVVVAQTTGSFSAVALLRGRAPSLLYLPAEVLRSYLLFVCWMSAFVGRTIKWRGHPFRLGPGSKLSPLGGSRRRRARAAG